MTLSDLITQYVTYRQSLGAKFITNARQLRQFVKFIGKDCSPTDITEEQTTAFMLYPTNTVTRKWFSRHSDLNGLFNWAIARGIIKEAPLTDVVPRQPSVIKPYIYSNDELERMFEAALHYQQKPSKTYPECMRMLLQVTYFLGLRLHEALHLRIGDVNLDESYALIRETKFYKSRYTPFNHPVRNHISCFMDWRKDVGMPDGKDDFLFLTRQNKPMRLEGIWLGFSKIRAMANIFRNDGAVYQPRIHDLRHTFAVNRLTQWYREGKNVQEMLPLLSTYLGHAYIGHTSVYLTMTDALLEEANNLFEKYVNPNEIKE